MVLKVSMSMTTNATENPDRLAAATAIFAVRKKRALLATPVSVSRSACSMARSCARRKASVRSSTMPSRSAAGRTGLGMSPLSIKLAGRGRQYSIRLRL